MKTQTVHPHAVRWGLALVALVILTLVLLIAGPAAQDQATPAARTSELPSPAATE